MVKNTMDPMEWLRKQLEEADTDLLREMVRTFVDTLMDAEANAACGAEYRERSPERVNRRNGYRPRQWDTRTGTIDLFVPKLREGAYFPGWLLEPRRRAETALTAVIAECYIRGVSTRRVEGLVQTLGINRLSKSQVSEMAKTLDDFVEDFRNRPLDAGPCTYLWLDALTQRVREGDRIINISTVIAIGVNSDGHREILGCALLTSEDGSGWTAFLRSLIARGLSGISLVVSDSHFGLKEAVAAVLPGASWQRCRTHFMKNLMCRVPRTAQGLVGTLVRSIFAQPDADSVYAQHRQIVEQLEKSKFNDAAAMLEDAGPEILAFASFPKEHWKQIWSNNPLERLNREVRRRTDVVGIFPDRPAIIRLVGAVLAEQHDEWQVGRRYMSRESLSKSHLVLIDTDDGLKDKKEVTKALPTVS